MFSEKYLSVDKFLRPYIDVEGYFPISLLLFIPAIQSFGVDALFLMDTLEECPFAEVDKTRFTVRPKQNWEKVSDVVLLRRSGFCRMLRVARVFLAMQ